MAHPSKNRRIRVLHASAPTCWWSWGFEAVLNRLGMVYGDQIDLRVVTLSVTPSKWEDYLEHYGMTEKEVIEWRDEAQGLMRVPITRDWSPEVWFPGDNAPATHAVLAAERQGKGARLNRELLRRLVVENRPVTEEREILDAAKASGLDLARFRRDFADREAIERAAAEQHHGLPHVPLGFYNIVVTDGDGRSVLLDHAFDPWQVESAIDWLSGGSLRKARPTDVVAYLRRVGPAPQTEIERVFALPEEEAARRLATLEKEGQVRTVTLGGYPFWTAAA